MKQLLPAVLIVGVYVGGVIWAIRALYPESTVASGLEKGTTREVSIDDVPRAARETILWE